MPAPGPCRAETAERPQCHAMEDGWLCTRAAGHPGKHHAHGPLGECFCTWPQRDPDRPLVSIRELALALVLRLERDGYQAAELDQLRRGLGRRRP